MKRLQLFPDTTKIENDRLTIAGQGLDSLAEEYGTPLYVYDCATMDNAVKTYNWTFDKINGLVRIANKVAP